MTIGATTGGFGKRKKVGFTKQSVKGFIWITAFLLFCFCGKMTASAAAFCSTTGEEEIVICIDAGHGGTSEEKDFGCRYEYDGTVIVEKEINLEIAGYLVEELSAYKHVKTVMTRDGDVSLSNKERAQIARKKGADILVSTHVNAADPWWSGPSILATCSTYQPEDSTVPNQYLVGTMLAYGIEQSLMDLGVCYHTEVDNDIQAAIIRKRNCEEDGARRSAYYPDGSYADYYGLIRFCKESGMPAVIVEHAFLSNESDYRNFLSTSEQRKTLAIQDAKGIAQALGLVKE